MIDGRTDDPHGREVDHFGKHGPAHSPIEGPPTVLLDDLTSVAEEAGVVVEVLTEDEAVAMLGR